VAPEHGSYETVNLASISCDVDPDHSCIRIGFTAERLTDFAVGWSQNCFI
jgi:hypothetical protein